MSGATSGTVFLAAHSRISLRSCGPRVYKSASRRMGRAPQHDGFRFAQPILRATRDSPIPDVALRNPRYATTTSPVAAFFRLAVQKGRQTAATAAFFALLLRGARRRLGSDAVAFETKRPQPLGLGAQGRGFDFVFGGGPLRRLRSLQLGKLPVRLLPFGIVCHVAILFG